MNEDDTYISDGMNFIGASFPKSIVPTQEVMRNCDFVKKLIIKFPVVLLKINSFNEVAMKALSTDISTDKYKTPMSEELRKIIEIFISNSWFALIFSHLIACDDAYRYRIQGLFGETTKKKLIDRPIREIRRLIKISVNRDEDIVSTKFKMIGNLITLVLLIPKYRKLFRKAISQCNYENLLMDEADRYWSFVLGNDGDYKRNGETYKRKEREFISKGWTKPTIFEKVK